MTQNAPNPKIRHALTVKRADDFAQWYQQVVSEGEMAEESARAAAWSSSHGAMASGSVSRS
jgi:hypothetical protein